MFHSYNSHHVLIGYVKRIARQGIEGLLVCRYYWATLYTNLELFEHICYLGTLLGHALNLLLITTTLNLKL